MEFDDDGDVVFTYFSPVLYGRTVDVADKTLVLS